MHADERESGARPGNRAPALLASITTPAPGPPHGHDQPARTRQPRTTSQRDGIPDRQ